jgi:hypothetical protein
MTANTIAGDTYQGQEVGVATLRVEDKGLVLKNVPIYRLTNGLLNMPFQVLDFTPVNKSE